MELDLNEEPMELDTTHASVIEFDSMLDELESAQGHIQDRIRHLEAVTSRARQRHRWPPVHTPIQITNFTGEATTANVQAYGREPQEVEEVPVESGRRGKRKGAHLIAKALGVETDASKLEGNGEKFFDCNICLDMARDPVLTCCGHLFCWPCFYQLSYAYSNARECPVCKGEVTEKGIIPIYGNGSASSNSQRTETGLRVPPRPRAPRIESTRQQLISQGASSSRIQNILRVDDIINARRNLLQFGDIIDGRGTQVQSEIPYVATDINNVLLAYYRLAAAENNQHTHFYPYSGSLMQGRAASFSPLPSTLNSAMNSTERLDEDLVSYIHGQHVGGSRQLNPHAVNRDSTFSVAATNHSESLSRDVAAINSAAAAFVSPLSRNNGTTAAINSDMQTTDSGIQIRSSGHSSSYSRRRTGVSRQVSNGTRRIRRLR